MKNFCLSIIVLSLPLSCAGNKMLKSTFNSTQTAGPTPWTHQNFDDRNDKFQFAILSDLWGGERPDIFNVAIQQLNLIHPEFIMSVGDLIDGGHEDVVTLHKEWDNFDQKIAKAKAPFFYVGGNHDLTNVTMRQVWNKRHGPRYYHFVYKDVLFLVLDSEDYTEERMDEIYKARAIAIEIMNGKRKENAATSDYFKMPERRVGEISQAQSAYFQNIILSHPEVRHTFLFMHKPVWLREGEGGLQKIEEALTGRQYTVFNGHQHTYQYTEKDSHDYIMLGTTGGAQNDKSDMAFDHFTLVTMTSDGPSIANLKLEGVLNKRGFIPAKGDTLCFQASNCLLEKE